MNDELKKLLETLPHNFFGTVKIAYQNGTAGVVKVTRTLKLSSRENRGTDRESLQR